MMKHEVALLVPDQSQARSVCAFLRQNRFAPVELDSLAEFDRLMQGRGGGLPVLILDLDAEGITNAVLRQLKQKHPVTIIALSRQQFHPDLEESLRHHVYACLGWPVDPEELSYVLKSVFA